MSKNEWERGEIKLPSSEFTGVRKTIQDADTQRKREAFDRTQTFWKSLTRKQRTNHQEYNRAVNTWYQSEYEQAERHGYHGAGYGIRNHQLDKQMDTTGLACDMLQQVSRPSAAAPRRVLAADMDYPTNRTTEFHTGSGATITFDRASSTVAWETDHNNHSVDQARSTILGRTLFERLKQVAWTRGTGGALTGNDEHHRDDDSFGGGANYHTESYGPLGAQEAPDSLVQYTDSQGRLFAAAGEMKPNRYTGMYERTVVEVDAWDRPLAKTATSAGPQGRVGRGVAAGGQFAHRHHAEPTFRL